MRRADRLFQIMLFLGRGTVVRARELAERLEVSERTIYRDVADLGRSGVPIEGEAGVGYLLRGGYRLPPLMFDADELEALALGSRMVKGWTDPALGKAAERALLKIEAVLPADRRSQLAHEALLVPDFHVPPAMVAPLGQLRLAIAQGRKVRFDYVRADGAPSTRTAWPLGLFFWGGTWTLGAWCELRGEYRSFRVDRLSALTVLDEVFDGARERLLEDYIRVVSAD